MLRQPSSLVCDPSLRHDLRIDQHDFLRRILAGGQVDHRDPFADADLRSRQAYAARRVHRFEHVVDQIDAAPPYRIPYIASACCSSTGWPYFVMG